MPITSFANITGSIKDLLNTLTADGKITLEVSSTTGAIPDGTLLRVGPAPVAVQADGTANITDLPCLPQTGYTDYRWNLRYEPDDPTSKAFTALGLSITANTTWAALAAQVTSGVPITPGAVADAQAARDTAVASAVAAAASAASVNREANNGVAGLDAAGKLTSANRLPDAGRPTNLGKPVGQGELLFNAMDYGAVGDGGTADTTGIQAALTAAAAGSSFGPAIAWLPWTPKGYRINGNLVMKDRVTLRGERRVRIRRTGSASTLMVNSTARGWAIENLTIDDSLGLTTSAVIRASTNTRDYAIRDCKFVGGALGTSRAITNKQLTSNVATITLDEDPADLEVGSVLHVSQVDATFDGDWTATAVSHSAPFSVSFALTAANVASTSVYGGWLNGETRRTVISKAAASNVVTLETSAAHGYSVGAKVFVTGVEGENFAGGTANGAITISAVPDATHFSYTPVAPGTHANIGTTASGGTVGYDSQSFNNGGILPHAIDHQNGVIGGLIEDNWFEGFANNIRIPDTQRVTVQRNLFTNWTTRCLYLIGQTTSACEDVWILHNRIRDMHIGGGIRQAIAIQGVNDTYKHKRGLIAFNTVLGVNKSWTAADPGGSDQISLQRCEDFRVIGNVSQYGGDLGINMDLQCQRVIISNNNSSFNDNFGCNIGSSGTTYCTDIQVTNNTFANNGQNRAGDRTLQLGMSIAGFGQHVLISGNIFTDDQTVHTQNTGVYLTNATDVEFGTNTFNAMTTAKISIGPGCSDIRGVPTGQVTSATPSPGVAGAGGTTDTTMWTATVIPAATLAVGQAYRLRVHGNMDSIATPGAFNLRLKIGTTTVWTIPLLLSTATSTNTATQWMIEADIIIETLGASGVASILGTTFTVTGATNTRASGPQQTVAATYDLSTGLGVVVSANTATGNAGNIIRLLRATLTKAPATT